MRYPFVVAVRCEFGTDTDDALNALYGAEQVTFRVLADGSTETRPGRADDGLFWGPRGPRNRRVSAALVTPALEPWTVGERVPTLWLHPKPEVEADLATAPWGRAVPVTADDGQGRVEFRDVPCTPFDFFDLAPGWPGFDNRR